MLVGVISDTHGLLRPEAVEALRGVQLIIHAGDIGKPEVIEGLRALAPVTAVRGNCDIGPWAEAYPLKQKVEVEGISIVVIHDLMELLNRHAIEGAQALQAPRHGGPAPGRGRQVQRRVDRPQVLESGGAAPFCRN